MSKLPWPERLDHILVRIQRLEDFTHGLDYEQFVENDLVFDACERQFEVIAEASKYIPQEIKEKYSDIGWADIVGMRNIITHDYSDIRSLVIWDTIQNDLEALKSTILNIKKNIK